MTEIAIIMGSSSDWEIMQHAATTLSTFQIPYEAHVVSAHRTPDWMVEFAKGAHAKGFKAIIAGAGGAAHLPGMTASFTTVPVLGVPIPVGTLQGQDALLSIVQMPKGVPVATFAIGIPGAVNAALFAVALLGQQDRALTEALLAYRKARALEVMATPLPAVG